MRIVTASRLSLDLKFQGSGLRGRAGWLYGSWGHALGSAPQRLV